MTVLQCSTFPIIHLQVTFKFSPLCYIKNLKGLIDYCTANACARNFQFLQQLTTLQTLGINVMTISYNKGQQHDGDTIM